MGMIIKMGGAIALAALPFSYAKAQAAPDLSIARVASSPYYEYANSQVELIVTNKGSAPAPSVNFTYSPGTPTLSVQSLGYVISPIRKGHSGRGGGYSRVGWLATQSPSGALAPGKSIRVKFYVNYPAGSTTESWTVDAGTVAQLNKVSHVAGYVVTASLPPIPSTPTLVHVTESASTDSLTVSWNAPSIGGNQVTSSTVTATPIAGTGLGTASLVATAAAFSTTISLPGVVPATTYSVTVQARTYAGTGPASTPINIKTEVAKMVAGAPVITSLWWNSTTDLACSWTPPAPGDSPIDDYQVSVKDGNGVIVTTDAGTATEGVATVDANGDPWLVTVRAHTAAGWGPWSSPISFGAGG